MKKAIIVASREEELTEEKRAKFDIYAKEHDLEIVEQVQYPSIMAILNPEEFVETILAAKPDVILTDDAHFLLADLYHDGNLLELFVREGVSVLNPTTDEELTQISAFVNKNFKQKIKDTVDGSLEQLMNSDQDIQAIAIITSDVDDERIKDAVSGLKKEGTIKACVVEIRRFTEEMKDELEIFFKDQGIEKIIIFDAKIMTPLLEDYLNYLEETLGIQVIYTGELKPDIIIN